MFYSDKLFEGGPPRSGDLRILTATVANGQTTLTWTSAPGASYTIEGTANLQQWVEIEDGVESGGETTEFTDEGLPAGTKEYYYRVLEQ